MNANGSRCFFYGIGSSPQGEYQGSPAVAYGNDSGCRRSTTESIEAVKNLILNEVNVKELKFVDNTAGILVKKIKPDFKKLGPRYGKIMKALAATIQSMSQEDINAFEKAGTFTLMVDGQEAVLERTDVEIISEDIPGWLVANEGRLTVALDITVTEDLRKEGLAREW